MIALTSTISSMSEMEKIDRCILDIAREGGQAALEQLYLCTKDAIYGYALSILKNTHDAEDVLHDCYISIYQTAHSYVSARKPMAWIFTITRNLCLSKIRSRSHFTEVPEEDWEWYLESNDQVSPEDRIVLEDCLRSLEDDEREILLLHVLSGMKHREIAELLKRPLSTILSKYHRALKKMRALLEKEDGQNG
ncbi:MAG: RNA polymerase sigma factor [Lachnospiraceae bacterium]|nr:RNA polymerase sigma factor [Candidatus Minthocola equi]